MKFGCCLNMVATRPDGTGIEFLGKIAELGYDYVELPLAEMTALSDEEFEEIKKTVERSGIRCETCNNFFPGTIRLTGADVHMDEVLAYADKALGRAEELGVQYVVFGSGKAKGVPEGFPMDEGYAQVVELLKKVSPLAVKHNITIVIEQLRRAECNLINSFAEGCKLSADASVPNVKVLVDFYHMTVENEPVENILTMGKENLRHVHFANPTGRVYPNLDDEADYKPFFDALKEIGYDARISCEAYVKDFDKEAEQALAFFKRNW
ncbi:MAG: sugar phosphate isomerase/epimerase [Lachnospiraceae bacterium]|nr:sugar phosphate isomerase/epimerase [Lachnospiraceae bacterium]